VGSICDKNRGWKSRETITLREPQFCFKFVAKIVLDPKFLQGSRVKISIDSRESRYEISVCESRKSESRYEIFLQDLRKASLATNFHL
jgi:hypothetical protein